MYYLRKSDVENLIKIATESPENFESELSWFTDDAYEEGQSDVYAGDAMSDLISDEIISGEFDYVVKDRAEVLGMVKPPSTSDYENLKQSLHRANCPNGVYGWEYCANCTK